MASARTFFIPSVVVVAIAAFSAVGYGRKVATSRDVPAAEALANVEAWIIAHAADGAGCRALGRIHALAWAYGDKIPLVSPGTRDALPTFAETSTVLVSRTGPRESLWNTDAVPSGDRKDRPVTAEEARHLAAAIAAYRKALELDAGDALSELGLAWMLAQQGLYARDLPADYWGDLKLTVVEKAAWTQAIGQLADEDPKVRDAASKTLLLAMPRCVPVLREVKADDPEAKARIDAVLQGYFELQALDHYRKAFDLRAQADLNGQPTYQVDSQIGAQAGAQIVAILARHPEAAKKGESKAITEVLDPLAKKWESLMRMPQ